MIRRLTSALATIMAAAMTSFATTPPAAADPYWQAFTHTDSWHCSKREVRPSIFLHVCVIIVGPQVQAAVRLGNYTGDPISIAAPHLKLYRSDPDGSGDLIYDRSCYASTLNSGFARACIGPSTYRPCDIVSALAIVEINGARPGNDTDKYLVPCSAA
jgi:hypothetical protein